jgi:hypothetical protein
MLKTLSPLLGLGARCHDGLGGSVYESGLRSVIAGGWMLVASSYFVVDRTPVSTHKNSHRSATGPACCRYDYLAPMTDRRSVMMDRTSTGYGIAPRRGVPRSWLDGDRTEEVTQFTLIL